MKVRPIRIAFLIRSLGRGGAERQLVTLAVALARRGHDISVVHFYGGGSFIDDLRSAGIKLVNLQKRGRWDLRSLLTLVSYLQETRPDVLYSYLVEPNIAAALCKPFIGPTKIVWSLHAAHISHGSLRFFPHFTFLASTVLARLADLIVVCSKAAAQFHCSWGYPKKTMRVIHYGIDTHMFQPDEHKRCAVREQLGVSDDEKLLGLVARFDPVKDHGSFLQAAAQLATRRADVRFLCVGTGLPGVAEELRRQLGCTRTDNRFIFHEAVDDVERIFNGLDVLCSSSMSEGFGYVVGEAMATGTPCVATDVGAAGDLIGGTGVVVPPGRPQELAQAMLSMLTHLDQAARAARRAARERIVERFAVARMVDLTQQALTDLSLRR